MYITQYGRGKIRMIAGVSLGIEDETGFTNEISIYSNPTSAEVVVELNTHESTLIEIFHPDGCSFSK
ncbi:MAG: hypothetical protein ACI865_000965 [Flavobacteriaceae bacterium]|jgi:hypothetical protein